MPEITLYKKGQPYNVLYDECDQWLMDKYVWMLNGGLYVITKIRISTNVWKTIFLHRLILGITEDKIKGDHKNGNQRDNRRENLRKCSQQENTCNKKIQSNNVSGLKGVYWDKQMKKWRAKIMVNYKSIHIGLYKNKIDAGLAYDKAAIKIHGEFAKPNFKTNI